MGKKFYQRSIFVSLANIKKKILYLVFNISLFITPFSLFMALLDKALQNIE